MTTQISHIKNSRLDTSIAAHKLSMAIHDFVRYMESQKESYTARFGGTSESFLHISVQHVSFHGEAEYAYSTDEERKLDKALTAFEKGMLDEYTDAEGKMSIVSLDRIAYLENVGDGDMWISKVSRDRKTGDWTIVFSTMGLQFMIDRRDGFTAMSADITKTFFGLA